MDYAFVCKGLFAGSDDALQRRSAIICRDGLIEKIVSLGDTRTLPRLEARTIDAGNWVAIPGLIDSHAHLAGNIEEQLLFDDSDPAASALQGLRNTQSALAGGLTTVRDCGAPGRSVLSLRAAIRAGWLTGPDVLASGPPLTTTGGHLPNISLTVDGAREAKKAVRQLARMGVDFVKVMVTGGGGTPGSNIFVSHFDAAELQAICDEAHRLQLKVGAHLHGTEGIRMAAAAGVDFFEHCSWLTRDGAAIDENVLRQVQERAVCVILTLGVLNRRPTSKLRPELDRVWGGFRTRLPQLIRRMREAGITLVLGTDAGTWKTPFNLMYMALEDLVQGAGFSPADALHAATSIPARALGLPDRGTLVPGMRADITFIDGDPLQDVTAVGRVMMTAVKGQVVYSAQSVAMIGSRE